MRDLGRRIRQRRVKSGRSLREVAGTVGKSHAWLSTLERGEGNPPAEVLTALAQELGDDPAEYLRLAGRVNLAAAHVVPVMEEMPGWARRLEDKVDALSEAVRLAEESQVTSAEGLKETLVQVRELLSRGVPPSGGARGPQSGGGPGALLASAGTTR